MAGAAGWETVVGLEIHVQLATRSKIFSGASTAYGAAPNTQACAVDLALPGVLPVMNRNAARMAVRFGLAVDAEINRRSVFARKNYFYPDLPKGYQISQYEIPVVGRGRLWLDTPDGGKWVEIVRAHLEEDAGKSLHEDYQGMSGIDLNRAGTPLLEVVTAPDMRSAAEAADFMRRMHTLVRWIGICDGNMQEGSLRCDANVSVRRFGDPELGTRTEIKNVNSFRFVERAIEYEAARQVEILEDGGRIVQETRLYDPERNETRSMRGKEEAHDYRYFPDPDLPPMVLEESLVEAERAALPELPGQRRARFERDLDIGAEDAAQLTTDRAIADWFEDAVAAGAQPRAAANWINGELAARLNRDGLAIGASPVTPAMLAGLLARIDDQTISGKIAKDVFAAMWAGEGDADGVIEARGLKQITDDSAIEKVVDEVLARSATQVEQYRSGQQKVFGYFVGQVMKATGGKANPGRVNELLRRRLDG